MVRSPTPRVCEDIISPQESVFRVLEPRINLGYRRVRHVAMLQIAKSAVLVLAILSFIFGSVAAPTTAIRAANSINDTERQALEAQLKNLETQINQYESQVSGYQKQGLTLKGEITRLNNKIARLNLQIQAIHLTLNELDKKIGETQFQIATTEASIAAHRQTLGILFQRLYEDEGTSLVEIFLKNPKLSDFFGDLNNITLLQNNMRITIEQISDLRDQLKDKREQFALARADAASVEMYQLAQKNEVNTVKTEKNRLLSITKGQESKYQALLKQTRETAAQIRSRIFQLLGGGELTFETAYEYAKLASGATGIRAALILAVLDRESALGQNVGKCSYKTAMSPSNQTIFLSIVKALNIDPDVVTVSCPNRDGVYGGAMGPAQFTPATWNLYSDAVSRITQRSPASPWNNADAFVATALYLKDAMTSCSATYSSLASQERCVAAKYYAGGRWRSYLWTYGEAVVSRAQSFQEDIDTITG